MRHPFSMLGGNALAVLFYALLGAASALRADDEPPPVLAAPQAAPAPAIPVLPAAPASAELAVVLPPAPMAGDVTAFVATAPVADALPDVLTELAASATALGVAAADAGLATSFGVGVGATTATVLGFDATAVQAGELALPASAPVVAVPLTLPFGEANAAPVLRDDVQESNIGAWEPILARIATLPHDGTPHRGSLTREQENLIQLRGYLRNHGTNPATLDTARRVLGISTP